MFLLKLLMMFIHFLFYFLLVLVVCLALWTHMPMGRLTYVLMLFITVLAVVSLLSVWSLFGFSHPKLSKLTTIVFWVCVGGFLLWFFGMSPSNHKQWQDEFRHQFTYTQANNNITINHVRNFHWHGDSYQERWETRQYNLDNLNHLDMISTTWGNDNIAHIMLSFGFDDGSGDIERLVFSVETRKEIGEEFTTIGGFFRLFELSIIAGDEKDLIYTRTNIRKESVSVYPLVYDKDKIKQLFLLYLHEGQALNNKPQFYNSLISNCTTVIYDMVKKIDNIPLDYRVIVSGRLADYLHEKGVIDNQYSLNAWKKSAFANPKVAHLGDSNPISSKDYSDLIRQDLPKY